MPIQDPSDRLPTMADADLPERYREEMRRRKAAEAELAETIEANAALRRQLDALAERCGPSCAEEIRQINEERDQLRANIHTLIDEREELQRRLAQAMDKADIAETNLATGEPDRLLAVAAAFNGWANGYDPQQARNMLSALDAIGEALGDLFELRGPTGEPTEDAAPDAGDLERVWAVANERYGDVGMDAECVADAMRIVLDRAEEVGEERGDQRVSELLTKYSSAITRAAYAEMHRDQAVAEVERLRAQPPGDAALREALVRARDGAQYILDTMRDVLHIDVLRELERQRDQMDAALAGTPPCDHALYGEFPEPPEESRESKPPPGWQMCSNNFPGKEPWVYRYQATCTISEAWALHDRDTIAARPPVDEAAVRADERAKVLDEIQRMQDDCMPFGGCTDTVPCRACMQLARLAGTIRGTVPRTAAAPERVPEEQKE